MILFYTQDIQGDTATLSGQEAIHCGKVLRHKVGDQISLTDGHGTLYQGSIEQVSKKEVRIGTLQILEEQKKPAKLAIAICPTKMNARLEWFLEKATEIGITEIFLIRSKRTEKSRIKLERLQGIVTSAMKQSMNLHLPIVHDIVPLESFVAECSYDHKFIAHCMDPEKSLFSMCDPKRSSIVMIGPEGDFTEEEVQLCRASGWEEVSLGPSRYRTETAGIVAIHTLNIRQHEL